MWTTAKQGQVGLDYKAEYGESGHFHAVHAHITFSVPHVASQTLQTAVAKCT